MTVQPTLHQKRCDPNYLCIILMTRQLLKMTICCKIGPTGHSTGAFTAKLTIFPAIWATATAISILGGVGLKLYQLYLFIFNEG
ncbi:hypothetical protein IW16_17735 [Chryseobacterium vrystaatense]|uniref:Uncharacterized protein n=1 Tax=Chryseobacterium vrystaatense TaxID=307480 RepID=A0ABR4UJ63_9FLAO|nr:hypothetical protein IW16_17735 [Chryseobacterium vrystaatense]